MIRKRSPLYLRVVVTIALPFILIWAFVSELVRGFGSAFRYGWIEVRGNIEAYHRVMQEEDDE